MSMPEWFDLLRIGELDGYRCRPHLQCEDASATVAERLAVGGVVAQVVEFTRPDTTTHCAVLCGDVVVDLTYGQYDPDEVWPVVEHVATYAARHVSGPEPVDLVQRWDDAGWDVEDMAARWQELGLA